MIQEALRLLKIFSEAHGASGFEDEVRALFRREVPGSTATDRIGSVFCEKNNGADKPRIMLAAHMDEIGFAIQQIEPEGLLKFVTLGSWWSHTLLGQRVVIKTRSGQKHQGIIVSKPPHFLQSAEREKIMNPEQMYIDVGADSAEDVQSSFGIRLGDAAVPASNFSAVAEDTVLIGKAWDDRAGLAVLVQLLQSLWTEELDSTLIGVGTVQEEIGARGAQTAIHCVKPDLALVLEGTPADDFPGIATAARQGSMGAGPQIRLMDPSAMMNRGLTEFILAMAEQENIPVQLAVRRSGGTDAKALHLHDGGVPVSVIGIPVRYAHSHNGMINLHDYLAALRLLTAIVRKLDRATVASFTNFS